MSSEKNIILYQLTALCHYCLFKHTLVFVTGPLFQSINTQTQDIRGTKYFFKSKK